MKRFYLLGIFLFSVLCSFSQKTSFVEKSSDITEQLYQSINQVRNTHNLPSLEIDRELLHNFTIPHNQYQVRVKVRTHDENGSWPQRVSRFCGDCILGENVHMIKNTHEPEKYNRFFRDYMNSIGHKKNILNPNWNHIAISTIYDPVTEYYYNTINFIKK